MVREIHLTEVKECKDRDYLGKFSKESDYDEVIDHVWANEALPLPKLDVAWTI